LELGLASLGPMEPRIARAELAVATARLGAVAAFYEQTLGFAVEQRDGRVVVPVGADVLELVAAGDATDPFHHFALLVPGDRFDAARAWLDARAETLARDDGETVFPFDFWDARAVYFHDPAGNIVELIAHAGTAERGAAGDFSAAELAFVGAKAHTLILAPPGRGWLPTGRPAEPHAATVTLTGGTAGAVVLAASPERSVRRGG
jgi:hypothetical protein